MNKTGEIYSNTKSSIISNNVKLAKVAKEVSNVLLINAMKS